MSRERVGVEVPEKKLYEHPRAQEHMRVARQVEEPDEVSTDQPLLALFGAPIF